MLAAQCTAQLHMGSMTRVAPPPQKNGCSLVRLQRSSTTIEEYKVRLERVMNLEGE